MNKMDLTITINGTSYSVEVEKTGGSIAPSAPTAAVASPAVAAAPVAPPPPKAAPQAAPVPVSAGDTTIKAPMPGKVNKVNIKVGDKVAKGDVLMFLEAMKMQNEIAASVDGVIKVVNVSNDENVKPGQVLAVIGN